jgi:hypothetical protein
MKKMLAGIATAALVVPLLAGCPASTGVVAMGQGRLMVAKQAGTGFGGLGTLKADVYQEAANYCAGQHRTLHALHATESKPPFILGIYPRAELQFECVPAGS